MYKHMFPVHFEPITVMDVLGEWTHHFWIDTPLCKTNMEHLLQHEITPASPHRNGDFPSYFLFDSLVVAGEIIISVWTSGCNFMLLSSGETLLMDKNTPGTVQFGNYS